MHCGKAGRAVIVVVEDGGVENGADTADSSDRSGASGDSSDTTQTDARSTNDA